MKTYTIEDLKNPALVRDIRNAVYGMRLKPSEVIPTILTAYARKDFKFTDADGNPVDLNTSCIERDDSNDEWCIDSASGLAELREEEAEAAHQERLRLWCRDTFCTHCDPAIAPRVRIEVREMFLVIANILKAMNPAESSKWGAANRQE